VNYVLQDGDVVSLFPALSGGAAKLGPFHVGPEAIDLAALSAAVADPAVGAIVTFEGVVRNNARGKSVTLLEYEAYTPMAEDVLAQIAAEMAETWDLCGVAMSHRVGRLAVGVASIGIAVSSAHRRAAFAACAYAMDRIKEILPVWKKEFAEDGATWVEGPGEQAGV
jgi:molybdopterin synthase catalytic subunit